MKDILYKVLPLFKNVGKRKRCIHHCKNKGIPNDNIFLYTYTGKTNICIYVIYICVYYFRIECM